MLTVSLKILNINRDILQILFVTLTFFFAVLPEATLDVDATSVVDDTLDVGLTTVLSKAALLSCARFTCDIYANFFSYC